MPDREHLVLPEDACDADLREASPDGAVLCRAVYGSQELISRFEENWAALDIRQEIAALGYGLDSLFNRGRSIQEFTALTAALWKLALEQSFPEDNVAFFADFMEKSSILGKGAKRRKLQQRVQIYLDLCGPKKATDFTPVAVYMGEFFCRNVEDGKTLQFKLSLTIRRIYNAIFEHLI